MFNGVFERPLFRPAVNIGGLLDIPTGTYELGKHGESIMNGGSSGMTGIAARPNNFKTALGVYILAMMRRACHHSYSMVYDTEGTLYPVSRFSKISRLDNYLSAIDYEHDPQFAFTDLSRYSGDEFYALFSKTLGEKPKNPKEYMRTTPFLDIEGNHRQALYPTSGFIDSLSKFQISAVTAMYEKNKIGEGGNNTDAMTNGKAKNQMFNQLPQLCARTGTYLVLTAHVGDIINLEMYPTDKRNLSNMKMNTVLKGVSGGFYSLPNNVWEIRSNKPLLNKDKMPIYPVDNSTAIEGDSDLVILEMINLRGKGGMSGLPISLIMSQTQGYLPSLSEFHYCKENAYGIGGNMQNYYLELRPDVKLSRTVVRKKLDADETLRRAIEIQSEMLQLIQFHRTYDSELLCDPKTLYEDLKAIGYDWDVLLNTRGYWVFEEEKDEHDKPFLSTMDLLRMRQGLYVPYWWGTEAERETLKSAAIQYKAERLLSKTA
jgi:hypothetical protein